MIKLIASENVKLSSLQVAKICELLRKEDELEHLADKLESADREVGRHSQQGMLFLLFVTSGSCIVAVSWHFSLLLRHQTRSI